ncbi:MAG TPA: DUF6448 family protein [Longimicrobiales bacterium]|nr:DUF6448 family protein [Longimicrobiales bacterium]
MSRRWARRAAAAAGIATAAALGLAAPAAAHCDSVDGPVVAAAREALAADRVEAALAWVRPQDEAEIRAAFRRTREVRAMGGEARELADLWFFETLVRVHREGEGAPYTGLKPAGTVPPAGIAAADQALAEGSGEALAGHMAEAAAAAAVRRFQAVKALEGSPVTDVEGRRRYVRAYVDYIHFVEAVHALLSGAGGAHGEGAAATGGH